MSKPDTKKVELKEVQLKAEPKVEPKAELKAEPKKDEPPKKAPQKWEVKMVKAYQAVKFEGTEHNYFLASKYRGLAKLPIVEITELDNGQVVVENEKDKIKIGVSNIAYVQYIDPAAFEASEKLKRV